MVTTRSQSRAKRPSCGCAYRGAAGKASSATAKPARAAYRSACRVPPQGNPKYRAAVLSAMKEAAKSGASKVMSVATGAGDKLLEKGYQYASGQTHKDCMEEARKTFENELKKDPSFCDWDRAKKFGIVMAAGLRAGIVFLALYEVGIAQSVYSFLQTDYYGWLKWIVQKSVEYTFGMCASSAFGRGGLSNSFLGYIPFLKAAAYTGDLLVCGVVVGGITLALETTVAKAIKGVIETIAKMGTWAARSVHEVMNTMPYLRPVYLAHLARTMTLPDASPAVQKEYQRYVTETTKDDRKAAELTTTKASSGAKPLMLEYKPERTAVKKEEPRERRAASSRRA